MGKTAVILVVISAVMHALRNFYTKQAGDKQVFVWWYEVAGMLFFTPVFVSILVKEGPSSFVFAPIILVSGVLHFIYWCVFSKALEKGDLSLVYPIMRSSPALILLISIILLHEQVSFQGGIGIMLVVFGVYSINMKRYSMAEMFAPIRAVFEDRATQFAFLTLLSAAAYSIADKVGVQQIHPVIFAYVYPWISLLLYSAYIFKAKNNGEVRREWRENRRAILVCGVLGIFGYFLILAAFTLDRVSYITGLRQLSIVFAVLLGGHVLKEQNRLVRFCSALIIFSGCFLIAVSD